MDDPTLTPSRPLGADEPLLAAYVGVNWDGYYRPRFEALAAGGPAWMWNRAYRALVGTGERHARVPGDRPPVSAPADACRPHRRTPTWRT